MKQNPLISVIVPVYKVEEYLDKCVNSIIGQSYNNLEIILVDDGSPDRCGAICDSYMRKDSRVRVVHKKNGGLSSARNAGLEVATGEYIGFVDSDDYIDSQMYEQLLRGFDGDSNAGITSCMIKRVLNGDVDAYNPSWEISQRRIIPANEIARRLLTTKSNYTVWSKLFIRSLIGDVRFQEGKINEDVLFMSDLSENIINQGASMVEIPYYGYYYLLRGDSISNTTTKFLEYSIIENYIEMADEYTAKDPLLSRELSNYADLVLLNFYCKVVRLGLKEKVDELLPQVKAIKIRNITIISQKIKLLLIKCLPGLFVRIIRKNGNG